MMEARVDYRVSGAFLPQVFPKKAKQLADLASFIMKGLNRDYHPEGVTLEEAVSKANHELYLKHRQLHANLKQCKRVLKANSKIPICAKAMTLQDPRRLGNACNMAAAAIDEMQPYLVIFHFENAIPVVDGLIGCGSNGPDGNPNVGVANKKLTLFTKESQWPILNLVKEILPLREWRREQETKEAYFKRPCTAYQKYKNYWLPVVDYSNSLFPLLLRASGDLTSLSGTIHPSRKYTSYCAQDDLDATGDSDGELVDDGFTTPREMEDVQQVLGYGDETGEFRLLLNRCRLATEEHFKFFLKT